MAARPKQSRRGRPPKGEYAGKTLVANFRIRPDTKAALQAAAEASGRTISQESEHQLRRALFEMGTGPTFAVMRTVGAVLDSLINLKNPKARWLDDPYLFDQALKGIIGALEFIRPKGDPLPASIEESLELGGRKQAQLAMLDRLREIQLADEPSATATKLTRHQRDLMMQRTDLGEIAERPRIHGRTAVQTRQEHELSREYATLRRKAIKQPDAMTTKDKERLIELHNKLAELRETVDKENK